jgi:hypothetical protein
MHIFFSYYPKRGGGCFFFTTNPRGKSVNLTLLRARRNHYTAPQRGMQAGL